MDNWLWITYNLIRNLKCVPIVLRTCSLGCVNVSYLSENIGVKVTFSFNDRILFEKEVSGNKAFTTTLAAISLHESEKYLGNVSMHLSSGQFRTFPDVMQCNGESCKINQRPQSHVFRGDQLIHRRYFKSSPL